MGLRGQGEETCSVVTFILSSLSKWTGTSYLNVLNNDNLESAHPATGVVIQLVYILMLVLQIIAYVSQVHKVILPEGLVDHETVALDQVNITSNHVSSAYFHW